MAGGVEEVDHRIAVRELQHRRGDRDAPGLLHLHPVRHRGAPARLAVDRAGLGDDPRMQRQGLGQRRLTGVGVADDGEGAAARGFGSDAAGKRGVGGGSKGGGVGHVVINGMGARGQNRNRADLERRRPQSSGGDRGRRRGPLVVRGDDGLTYVSALRSLFSLVSSSSTGANSPAVTSWNALAGLFLSIVNHTQKVHPSCERRVPAPNRVCSVVVRLRSAWSFASFSAARASRSAMASTRRW